MGRMKGRQLFLCLFSFALRLIPTAIASNEVEEESEFSYVEGSGNGPEMWGDIRPEWFMCKNGSMQSPIDLMDERVEVVSNLGVLMRSYRPANAILKNRGHDIMLSWEGGAGTLHINGTDYILRQCHWHSPSEHAINGRRYDLELHMVHESLNGKVAVVGILYELGHPDTFLSSIMLPLHAMAVTGETEKAIGAVDPNLIQLGNGKYYRYMGSLTTPPCSENVLWTVLQKVRTVGKEQVRLLRDSVRDDAESNARPLQPINMRNIQLYMPKREPLGGRQNMILHD